MARAHDIFVRRQVTALLAVAILCVVVQTCFDGTSSSFEQRAIRDSAGIQNVESARSKWSNSDGWQVDSVPTVRIGGGVSDTVGPVGIVRARVLPDGRIMVATGPRGINHLLMFGARGNLQRIAGGYGGGPR